jgi:hypothetical protein
MNEKETPTSTSRLTDSLGALSMGALMQPFKSMEGLRRATAELIKVTTGQSTIAPQPNDRRFDDPAWQDNGLASSNCRRATRRGRRWSCAWRPTRSRQPTR